MLRNFIMKTHFNIPIHSIFIKLMGNPNAPPSDECYRLASRFKACKNHLGGKCRYKCDLESI